MEDEKLLRPEQAAWMTHVQELRQRLMWVSGTFVAMFCVGFFFSGHVVEWLKAGARVPLSFYVFAPAEALRVYVQIAFVVSLVITLPVLLYHLWRFVAPGLTDRERRAAFPLIPFSALLFVAGVAFAYYVMFPLIMRFLLGLVERLGAEEVFGIGQYFQFLFNFVVPIGLLFQMPVVLLFLARIELINPERMRHIRKYAYFVLLVIGALITPPDIVSHMVVTLPLILLYELSVRMANASFRRQQRRKREQEERGNGV